jgi:hypothetical protein
MAEADAALLAAGVAEPEHMTRAFANGFGSAWQPRASSEEERRRTAATTAP